MRMIELRAAVPAALGLVLSSAACSNPEVPPASTKFNATLRVDNEVPDTASDRTAGGTFTVSYANGTLNYTLTITTAPKSPITEAHIHSGAAGTRGLVRVNLCGASGVPACPAGAGTVTGSNNTVAGITMDSLLVLMRGYGAYVDVHTQAQTGGLMRGQLLPQP